MRFQFGGFTYIFGHKLLSILLFRSSMVDAKLENKTKYIAFLKIIKAHDSIAFFSFPDVEILQFYFSSSSLFSICFGSNQPLILVNIIIDLSHFIE